MKSTHNKYTKEVEETLFRFSTKEHKKQALIKQNYVGTNDIILGLKAQEQINLEKKGFSFYEDDVNKTFLKYNEVYLTSNVLEAKNLAFIYLDRNYKKITTTNQFNCLIKWIESVDNWSHSDSLSKFLTRFLELSPYENKFIEVIKKWNSSKNLWKRRQSLIALFYYARTKKQYVTFELCEQLISNLLLDNEYYVQKAVGWTLRESYQVYEESTYKFIDKNINKISPIAFTTCIEKMSLKQKNILKQKRNTKKMS
jgi:3-methyladenine DNA glycosylase AlkD